MAGEAMPLRFGPTAAGIILATAVCGLLMGSCAYVLQRAAVDNMAILGLPLLWALTASFIYAANQQSIGRIPQERLERFILCLAIALPFQLFVVIAGVDVFEGLGGHL